MGTRVQSNNQTLRMEGSRSSLVLCERWGPGRQEVVFNLEVFSDLDWLYLGFLQTVARKQSLWDVRDEAGD